MQQVTTYSMCKEKGSSHKLQSVGQNVTMTPRVTGGEVKYVSNQVKHCQEREINVEGAFPTQYIVVPYSLNRLSAHTCGLLTILT